jgi:hypothetical protein
MDHEIAHHRGALEHETTIETDGAPGRATAPTTALAPDEHPLEVEIKVPRQSVQGRSEEISRSLREPAPEHLSYRASVTRVAFEYEQPTAQRIQAQALSNSSAMHPPELPTRRKIDLCRWKWSNRDCARSRFFSFSLYPGAMSFDESLNSHGGRA